VVGNRQSALLTATWRRDEPHVQPVVVLFEMDRSRSIENAVDRELPTVEHHFPEIIVERRKGDGFVRPYRLLLDIRLDRRGVASDVEGR
jgi:hypothetical protein